MKRGFRVIAPIKLESLDDIGPVNALVMTAEFWDAERFATAAELNGYAGPYPELRETGNY